jgi:outer membrane protein, multidrug efflux system
VKPYPPCPRNLWIAASAIFVALLVGCSIGPSYHRPTAFGTNELPQTFAEATTNSWKQAEPAAHLARGEWWSIFRDTELNRLETIATAGNQEVAATVARFNQARALVNVARSDLYPHVSSSPTYARERTSANRSDNGERAGTAHNFNNFIIPLDASWELDLWGRVRQQVESARARLAATSGDLQSLQLSIQAEVAIDYFTLRLLETQHAIVTKSIETYQRSLELTRNRRAGGIASDLDVSQAETQLRSAEAQLPALERESSRVRHALGALCGQPPGTFSLATTNVNLETVPSVPLSLPSELLERRPDISAAEQRMIAANAQVGVAQTAFYPRLTVGGTAGLESISASSLFTWPSRFWAVGPTLEIPLFTGGRNRANLEATRAGYDETVANYRQTVISAFQEVEDQLAAQRLLATEIQAQAAALAAARRTLEIANNRYKAGLVTFLEVAVAQAAALERELNVGRLQAERLSASASLAKALGGGWMQ